MDKSVAIVTGAARGIGRSIAEALLKEGYKVCLVDVNALQGQKTRETLVDKYGKDNVIFLTSDVSKEFHVESLFDEVLRQFKRVDVLVNNAGVLCEDDIDKTVDVNLKGPIHGCRMAFKYMGKDMGHNGGKIVNVASIAGLMPAVYSPVYSATKHGVVGLTRCYGSPEVFERTGIIVNAICPAYVLTELQKPYQELLPKDFGDVTKRADMMSPDYIGEGVIKLLKEELNGATLLVTKGLGFKYVGLSEELQLILNESFSSEESR